MRTHRYYGMNLKEAALLVKVYLEVEKEPRLRQQKLGRLSAAMLRQQARRAAVGAGFGSLASLNYQFNKLEYLMTDGKRGFGGACPQVLLDIVDLYRSDHAAFQELLDKAEGKQNRKAKKESAPAREISPAVPAGEEAQQETPASPDINHGQEAALPAAPAAASREPVGTEKADAPAVLPSGTRLADGSPLEAGRLARTLAALELTPEDPVTNLPLSHRLGNALVRNGVYVIGDFLKLSADDMGEKLRLGKTAIREACLYQEALRATLFAAEPAPTPAADARKAAEPVEAYGAEVPGNGIKTDGQDTGSWEPGAEKINSTATDMAELSLRRPQLMPEDSIDKLGLPNRLANTLHRNDVHTIGAFCRLRPEDMLRMRNLGKKSVQEAQFYQKFLEERFAGMLPVKAEKPAETAGLSLAANPEVQEKLDFMQKNGIRLDSPASSLPLSNRGKNILSQSGVKTVGNFFAVPFAFWRHIKNCGRLTQEEFQTVYEAGKLLFLDKPADRHGQSHRLADGITSYLGESLGTLVVRQLPAGEEAGVVPALWKNRAFQGALFRRILLAGEKNGSLTELKKEIPPEIYDEQAFQNLVGGLLAKKKITLDGDVLSIRYPTVQEYIDSIPKENYREALQMRLDGLTLEEIGKRLGVTRERVRQMNRKVLEGRPVLADDRLLPVWEKYRHLADEDFEQIFGWPKERLSFFRLLSDARKTVSRTNKSQRRADDLLQIIHDFADHPGIVAKVRQIGHEVAPYILIDGRKIPKSRPGLLRYAAFHFCRDTGMPYKAFKQKYEQLLETLGLDGDDSFTLNSRSSLNQLSRADYILWTRGQHMRYYDINSVDTEAFFDDIGLYNYGNVEISTRKILLECPDVMKAYDIRDEYELHNLLKKLWEKDPPRKYRTKSHTMTFGRMPVVTIGQGNREQQVMDLLNENAPISQQELAEKYEEEYGVRASSVLANYFTSIAQYLNQKGIFTTSWPELSEDAKEWLKDHLTKDFYYIRDIEDILLDEFPEEHVWAVNSHTLRELGFIPASRYVVRNTFGSPIQYFRSLLARDVCDLRGRQDMMNIGAFYAEVYKQKENFQIVEMEPYLYERMEALNRQGVTLEGIHDFWKEVNLFQADGSFFTIHSLKREGFALPWPEQPFKDWFYSSLLVQDREHFSYIRFGGARLLRKSPDRFSMADFLNYVADHVDGTVEFHDFVRLIKKTYGFCPQETKIKDTIADDYELSQKVEVF